MIKMIGDKLEKWSRSPNHNKGKGIMTTKAKSIVENPKKTYKGQSQTIFV
jgi:hypothetical protein